MSRLSDLVSDSVIENTKRDGTIDKYAAVLSIKPLLDGDDREVLVSEALNARVTKAAKSTRKNLRANATRRDRGLPFIGLHSAYPLDIDGQYIKRTESLTRAEFERVISIREKQIVDDMAHLKKLRQAFTAMLPFWDSHPDWTVQQCAMALSSIERSAA